MISHEGTLTKLTYLIAEWVSGHLLMGTNILWGIGNTGNPKLSAQRTATSKRSANCVEVYNYRQNCPFSQLAALGRSFTSLLSQTQIIYTIGGGACTTVPLVSAISNSYDVTDITWQSCINRWTILGEAERTFLWTFYVVSVSYNLLLW